MVGVWVWVQVLVRAWVWVRVQVWVWVWVRGHHRAGMLFLLSRNSILAVPCVRVWTLRRKSPSGAAGAVVQAHSKLAVAVV